MNNLYYDFKQKQQKEYDDFSKNSKGIFYAFSNSQFKEGMEKIGLTENDTDKIYRGYVGGMFIKKEIAKDLKEFLNKQSEEMEKQKENDQFLYNMFYYELGNHEYGYTYELEDTVESCGFTLEEIKEDKRLSRILEKARKDYLKNCNN